MTNVTNNGINMVSFLPQVLSFSDILGIVSVVLGIISILLSLIIYKLSNATSEKLAEEAAQRAFEKQNNQIAKQEFEKDYVNFKEQDFTKEQKKGLKKKIRLLNKRGYKNSKASPWVYAALFPIIFKNYIDEDITVFLMHEWKRKNIISWNGRLENNTKIFIEQGELLSEDINSR